jgi:predicted MFS family arabinose efflux permease
MLSTRTLNQRLALFTTMRLTLNTPIRMVYPFLAIFAVNLNKDVAMISLALAASMATSALGPFIAPIADRRGRKVGMLIGLSIFLAGMLAVSGFPSYLTFFLAIMLGNLGNNIFLPAMQAYLGDHTPYDKRGAVLAVTELSWALSFILLVPLAGLLMEWAAWNSPYIALSLAAVLMIVLLLKFVPADTPVDSQPLTVFADIRKVLVYPPALFGILTGTLFIMGNEVVSVVFGVWMQQSFGLQVAALGAASMVIGFSELGGEGLAALLADRLGKERTIGLSLVLNALWVISLPWLGSSTLGAFIWLFFFYLTFEVAIVSILPLITEITPATRATMISLFIAALSLGRALGDLVTPVLFRGGFMVNAVVCAGLDLLALAALTRIRLPKGSA